MGDLQNYIFVLLVDTVFANAYICCLLLNFDETPRLVFVRSMKQGTLTSKIYNLLNIIRNSFSCALVYEKS